MVGDGPNNLTCAFCVFEDWWLQSQATINEQWKFRLKVSGSFAPPTLQGMGIMAECHAGSASSEKNPGWLGYIRDYTILPIYIGIILNHDKDPY